MTMVRIVSSPLPYRGNLEWLEPNVILLVTHGSHAYGLNTPTSDVDIKGVAIPPREYFLGFDKHFEQADSKTPDMVVYDIRKFFKLAADCNPNIIEVLWGDPTDVRVLTTLGEKLINCRDFFLSKKCRFTFSGYAHAQLKRIATHYRWLKNPPKAPPTRGEFGLPERTVIPADQLQAAQAAVQKRLGEWHLDDMSDVDAANRIRLQNLMADMLAEMNVTKDAQYLAAARSIGINDNFLELLDKERQYKARKTEWDQFQTWQRERNPARAELESKWGYDTKHAMHLVRLMRMCGEILEGKGVIVKRPDRDELLAIRNGAWSYEELCDWSRGQDEWMAALYERSSLRHSPDRVALDSLCRRLVEAALS